MADLSKFQINGVDYDLKDRTARQNSGSNGGNSVYYMDFAAEYPKPDSEISFSSVTTSLLSNNGAGIKAGDIIVASNGTLCKVTSVSTNQVSYDPIGTISGDGNTSDSGGNAGFVVQDTPPEDTSVLWIDPTDNTTEVPENSGGKSVISYKNPAEVPLESGSQYIFYGSTGGTISVQVGSNENNKVDYQLSSGFDIVWILYVQTSEVQGSIIATSGTRKVINFEGDSSKMKISSTIPVWIVIKVG